MANVRYIAVPCDDELYHAVEDGCKKSGLKLGPEAAMRLRKSYKVGPFAPKNEEMSKKLAHEIGMPSDGIVHSGETHFGDVSPKGGRL